MNKRFFNKALKAEVILGLHFAADVDSETGEVSNLPEDVVELAEDHDFLKVLPLDKQVSYDVDGLPLIEDRPVIVETFAEACERRKRAINKAYVEAIELFLADYPPSERDTFPEQALEALALRDVEDASGVVNEDDYPMLKNIAAKKGISTSAHKDTVLAKRAAFNVACGQLTGEKYALFMQLEAIDSEAPDAIDQAEAVDESSLAAVVAALVA